MRFFLPIVILFCVIFTAHADPLVIKQGDSFPTLTKTQVQSLETAFSPNKTNLWAQFKPDYNIPPAIQNQPSVQNQINWFMKHQTYLYNVATQASPYLYYIYNQVKTRQLPTALALLPFIESAYNPHADSRTGAAGLWQLMPDMSTDFGLKKDPWYDGRRDLISSTQAALDYLTYLDHLFDGDWLLALAAYDAGNKTVREAIEKNEARGEPTDFWSLDLPEETKAYVPRLIALATIIANPERYPLKLPSVKNQPYWGEVDLDAPIDLIRAAHLAKVSVKTIYALNPGYERGITDPYGPQRLLLPLNKVSEFQNNLSQTSKDQLTLPAEKNTTFTDKPYWVTPQSTGLSLPASTQAPPKPKVYLLTYHVQNSDTVDGVADRFQVKPNDIRTWNKLSKEASLAPDEVLTIYTDHPP